MIWNTKTFGEVAVEFLNGGTPDTKRSDFWDGDIPWITGADIEDYKVKLGRRSITPKGLENSASNLAKKGSLLLVTRTGVGKAALAPCDLAISQDITAVILPDEVNPTFALYWWKSQAAKLSSQSQGAIIKGVTRRDVEALSFPKVSKPEQQEIVGMLEQANELRLKRIQASQLYSTLLPVIYHQYFGDTSGLKMKRLVDLGDLDRGKSQYRPRNFPGLFGGPYPFIQTGDVRNSGGRITAYSQTYSDLGLRQSRLWPKGTLCITIAANIAETGVLTFDACFPDSIVGFTPGPEITTTFVQWFIASKKQEITAAAPQAAQKNINLDILRNLLVPIPTPELLKKFQAEVDTVSNLRHRSDTSLTQLNALCQVLERYAFEGRLTSSWRTAHSEGVLQKPNQQPKLNAVAN